MKETMKSVFLMLPFAILATAANACFAQTGSAAASQPAAERANTAESMIVPHTAWNCSLPEGIPAIGKGVKAFEVELQLEQMYDLGKTPFGERRVFVVKGGTVT